MKISNLPLGLHNRYWRLWNHLMEYVYKIMWTGGEGTLGIIPQDKQNYVTQYIIWLIRPFLRELGKLKDRES